MGDNGKGLDIGIFLLTAGVVWLLSTLHIVTWSTLYALFTLWPLVLVALGIGFLARGSRLIRIVTWLVFVAVVIGYGYYAKPVMPDIFGSLKVSEEKKPDETKAETKAETTDKAETGSGNVRIEKLTETGRAKLSLDLGMTKLTLNAGTTALLDASINKDLVKYSQSFGDNNRTASIKFKMDADNFSSLKSSAKLHNQIRLNKDVIWEMILDTGMMEGELDLADLKVENIDIETGASMLKLNMGSFDTKLKIDAGASQIDITLPEDTGIRIKLDGELNSTNLDEPGWVEEDGWHYSPDFEEKEHKIEADVEMSIGKLHVSQ